MRGGAGAPSAGLVGIVIICRGHSVVGCPLFLLPKIFKNSKIKSLNTQKLCWK